MAEGRKRIGDKKIQPLVTVVIPVYQAQYYLRRCVDSVLSQTYSRLQVILVDDGSADASPQMCDEYAKMDERILVIHKQNGGASSARNVGIDAAKGEYITFVDSDDAIAPDMVEQLFIACQLSGGGLPICAVTRRMEDMHSGICREETILTAEEAMRELTLLEAQGPRFQGWSVGRLFKKSLFQGIRFPEGVSIGEDLAIMYRLFYRAGKVVFVNSPKYFYNENPDGMINSDFLKKDLLGILSVWDEFGRFAGKKYPGLEKYVNDRAALGAVNYYDTICFRHDKRKEIKRGLERRIRKSLPGLLWRNHPFSYKWKAVLIAFCPRLAQIVIAIYVKYICSFRKWLRMYIQW